jgi:hypothetical protein
MGKINMQKVIVGGLIAGVVLNAVDFVLYGVVLKEQMAAAMTALGKQPMTNAQMPWFVVLDFVAGIFLVWMYAAVRPGAGDGGQGRSGGVVRRWAAQYAVHVAHGFDAAEYDDHNTGRHARRVSARGRGWREVLHGRRRNWSGDRGGRRDGDGVANVR